MVIFDYYLIIFWLAITDLWNKNTKKVKLSPTKEKALNFTIQTRNDIASQRTHLRRVCAQHGLDFLVFKKHLELTDVNVLLGIRNEALLQKTENNWVQAAGSTVRFAFHQMDVNGRYKAAEVLAGVRWQCCVEAAGTFNVVGENEFA